MIFSSGSQSLRWQPSLRGLAFAKRAIAQAVKYVQKNTPKTPLTLDTLHSQAEQSLGAHYLVE
ncbi:hypothetical protein [[Haemophilus] ducreyi]|uniref:hypothetical protein n=1 Tax=Haemophilus ducreyi TaxID=730 RepID=UPI000654C18B|nr:hypothetical protein [[Haemophilus] ducreyi]AKO45773.1 hypothetical protein RZ66_06065 [[Haemophilus] ducreyi]AKO47160.1 hypothetical protein RZ67_05985 [[Haemophilus] ducreyi]AKO48522.1 hypothetical protein RZ68_06065 [[Haemophilus] ducreyi]AKO49892.1 hypothetical protein RZ69_06005 [[Haemophilus] ducreyi]ANF62399.1 hypothetical protein A6037_06630 [[Haemophilus] ducreyi]